MQHWSDSQLSPTQQHTLPFDLLFVLLFEAIQVPPVLLNLLADAPEVKKWMIEKLQMTDLQHRAPAVRQLHKACVPSGVQEYLADSFNNPDAYPDAVASVGHPPTQAGCSQGL